VSSVLVTGGSGRLGRYVVRELSQGHNVWNADLRAGTGELELALDILDLGAMTEACQRVECVVHLAALDFDTHSAAHDYIRVNVLGTWNVLEACAAAGVRQVVVCSSIAAVGLDEMRPGWTPQTLPVTEEHPVEPADPYSVSKYIMEIMAASFAHRQTMDVLCVRPVSIVFDEELDLFVSTVDEARPSLFAYVYAGDVAHAIRLALQRGWGSGYECVILSAGDTAHSAPTLEWWRRLFGGLPSEVDQSVFSTTPRASPYSSARARELLNWTARVSLAELRSKRAQSSSS
jgi:UDP-glucose 4-epimerase